MDKESMVMALPFQVEEGEVEQRAEVGDEADGRGVAWPSWRRSRWCHSLRRAEEW